MLLSPLIAALALSPVTLGNTFFDDFEDGNANGWLTNHGDWEVIFGIYHGIGRPNGQWVHNNSWNPATYGTGMSAEAVMRSDPGNDNVSKMLVLRYVDSQNFLFVNFVAGYRHFVVVEQVLNGNRTLLTPGFTHNIPEHGQTDWKRCRADLVGKTVIAYFEGARVLDVTLPAIALTEGSAGFNVFSSPGGGDEELFVDEFSWAASRFAVPMNLQVQAGVNPIGSLGTVSLSDNIYFQIDPAWNIARGSPNIRLIWMGNMSAEADDELILRYESSVTSGATRQVLEVFDRQAGQFVQLDSRLLSTSDSPLRFNLSNPARFLGTNGEIQVRASYFSPGDSSRYSLKVDEINVQGIAR